MPKEDNQLFIDMQKQLAAPQLEAAVDEAMEEMEYAPPPPNPLHPAPSEKQARHEFKEKALELMLNEEQSKTTLKGFDLIFEHLKSMENGGKPVEELLKAGEMIGEQIVMPALEDEHAVSDYLTSLQPENLEEEEAEEEVSDAEAVNFMSEVPALYESLGISLKTFQSMYQLGNQYFERKEFQKAVSVYEALSQLDVNCHEAWFAAGLAYYRLENWTEAIANFTMATITNPTNITAFTCLAYCHLHLDDREHALEMIDMAEEMLGMPHVDPDMKASYMATIEDLKKKTA